MIGGILVIFKPLYQLDRPSWRASDAGRFSDDEYNCVMLYLTRTGKPVALREFKTEHAKECHWQVMIGNKKRVFSEYAEANNYCKSHFYGLDGKPMKG